MLCINLLVKSDCVEILGAVRKGRNYACSWQGTKSVDASAMMLICSETAGTLLLNGTAMGISVVTERKIFTLSSVRALSADSVDKMGSDNTT